MAEKSNWRFFCELFWGYEKYFHPPKIKVLEKRNEYLERYPTAWAYYEPDQRTMFILEEHDCLAVRLHEYGHWINACLYFVLEVVWEFFWWGCGLREAFRNKGGKIRR